MNKYVIICDNSCALTKDLRERFGVDDLVVGSVVFPDGSMEKSDYDWEKRSPKDYFESMVSKKHIYKTSAVNIDEIKSVYRKHLEKGEDILAITISSGLSGTYNFSLKAKEELLLEFPDRKIEVVDSLRFSGGLGLLASRANENRKAGMSLEENAKWLEENKVKIHEAGPMDDLWFLARTGRISKAKAFFGSMAGVRPMGDFAQNGLTEVLGRAKGKKKALEAAVEYMRRSIVNPEEQTILISHSLREEQAEEYKKMILETIKPKEVIITWVDMTSGANIGPGLCAAFYFGEPISENNEKERALMAEVLK